MVAVMRAGLPGHCRRARAKDWRPEHVEGVGASFFCREMYPLAVEEERDGRGGVHSNAGQ